MWEEYFALRVQRSKVDPPMESEMVVFTKTKKASILKPWLWEENFALRVQRLKVDPPMESEPAVFMEKNA